MKKKRAAEAAEREPTQDEMLREFAAFFANKASLRNLFRKNEINYHGLAVDFDKVDGAKDFYAFEKKRRQLAHHQDIIDLPHETALSYILKYQKKYDQPDPLAEQVQELHVKSKDYDVDTLTRLMIEK